MTEYKKEYIKRPVYLEKIRPYIDKDIIKVLTGQRRVGKSYMLLQLMDEIRLRHDFKGIEHIHLRNFISELR